MSGALDERAPDVPSFKKYFIIPGDVGNSRSNPKQQLTVFASTD